VRAVAAMIAATTRRLLREKRGEADMAPA